MNFRNYRKKTIRQKANDLGWTDWAQKPDSQDLCFLTPNANKFWNSNAPEGCLTGAVQDKYGRVLGLHKGRVFYTHGQRKGLNISARERLFVTEIQAETNTLVVAPYAETLCQTLRLSDINWVSVAPWDIASKILVKTHYRSPLVHSDIIQTGQTQARLQFETAVPYPGPGQSCVFYDEKGRVLGGGKVCKQQIQS